MSLELIRRSSRLIEGLAAFGLAVLLVVAFHETSSYHYEFRAKLSWFNDGIAPNEATFFLYYLVMGIPAVIFLTCSLERTPLPRLLARLESGLDRPGAWLVPALLLALMLAAAHQCVVRGVVVTDDELTYDFIAKTLLTGRLVNPSPGDEFFFGNQFILISEKGWFGKYPIGHPLHLAAGFAFGMSHLVVPFLTLASLALLVVIGSRIYSRKVAVIAAFLLGLSPQFVLTGVTRLSQHTEMLWMLIALWSLLRLGDGGSRRFAALAGAALGVALLVRPMPGILFALVAAGWILIGPGKAGLTGRLPGLAALALPVLVAAGLLMWIHAVQNGHPLRTGYHAADHGMGTFVEHSLTRSTLGRMASSFFCSLLRQNFWLLGWPLSLFLIPLARRSPEMFLVWAFVLADYAYRLLVPKTVVAVTGPVYLAEIVPLLILLTASGLEELPGFLERHRLPGASCSRTSLVLAAAAIAAAMFLPYPIRDLQRSGAAVQAVHDLVARSGAKRALVFANYTTNHPAGDSWSLFPPNPSPDLQDPVLFVRYPAVPEAAQIMVEFWQRRFPDRRAFLFQIIDKAPTLTEIERGTPTPSPPPMPQESPPASISLSGEASTEKP